MNTEISLNDYITYTRPRKPIFLILSIIFEILYWMLFPFLIFVVVETAYNRGLLSLLSVDLAILLALVQLSGRLRKRFRVNAPKKIQKSKKDPILYLRSFYYEQINKRRRELLEKEASYFEKESDDEVLAEVLKDEGLLIAVGNPTNKIPPLGSVHLYFDNSEWKEQIKKLMMISQFVIIQPGDSEGTEWEMNTAKELVSPEKVIFSFLAWQGLSKKARQLAYEVFAMQFKRIYGFNLPQEIGNAYFLAFYQDKASRKWSPYLIGLTGWKLTFFLLCSKTNLIWRFLTFSILPYPFEFSSRLLRRVSTPKILRAYTVSGVREALRPFLTHRGIYLPIWKTVAFISIVIVLSSLFVYGKLYFDNPIGKYGVTGFAEDGQILFQGDLEIIDRTFKNKGESLIGISKLELFGLSMSSECFSTEEMATKVISFQVNFEERISYYSKDEYLDIEFKKESINSNNKIMIFDSKVYDLDRKLSRLGTLKFNDNGSCLKVEGSKPYAIRISRKFPWQ